MNNTQLPDPRLDLVNDTLRTKYWSWVYFSPEGSPSRLAEVLNQGLPHISQESWPERFDFGGVYINGRPALSDQELHFPCKIEYYEPKFPISQASSIYPVITEESIVYRDDDIVIAYKPARLSSMPAKEQRHFSLKSSLEKLLTTTIHMPSRLDVSAQGLVVVSISSRAHAPLQQAFESRRVTKRYICGTTKSCPWERKVELGQIGRDPRHPVLRVSPAEQGQKAETIFTNLGTNTSSDHEISVLCAQPITGRTHQIRVHASSNGLPLFGDKFYGGDDAPYLHLISSYVSCVHPITGKRLECILPASFLHSWMASAIERVPSLDEATPSLPKSQ